MEMLPYAVSSPECQPSPSLQVARIMWSVMNWPKPGAARISARRSGDTGLGFEVAANDRAMVATFLRRWRRGGRALWALVSDYREANPALGLHAKTRIIHRLS
jgi:hypothetical protein